MSEKIDKLKDIATCVRTIAASARTATRELALASSFARNDALVHAADAIRASNAAIKTANVTDMTFAKKKGVNGAMLDRLMLDDTRIEAIANGLESVAELPDPLGKVLGNWKRPNGLEISRVSVPLGVIGIMAGNLMNRKLLKIHAPKRVVILGSIGCALATKIGEEAKAHDISNTYKGFGRILNSL